MRARPSWVRIPSSPRSLGEDRVSEEEKGTSRGWRRPHRVGYSEAGDSEAGDSEAGDSEAGDSEAGDSEAGDSEAGDSEAGDSEAGDST